MIDWLTTFWDTYGPRSLYDWQTVAASVAWIAISTFIALYSRVTWWRGGTGRNIMALAFGLWLLASGSITRRLVHVEVGHWVLLVAWALIAVVIPWRTVQMWRVTHPRNAPPPPPAMPSPPVEGRQWYSPTPHSIIEPPRRDR